MQMSIVLADKRYQVDLESPVSLAIPLDFNGPQPSFFGTPPATAAPLKVGGFVGDTRKGGSCNVAELRLVPHCNGTHTESVGHLVPEAPPLAELLLRTLFPARLITVTPSAADETPEGYRPAKPAILILATFCQPIVIIFHEIAIYCADRGQQAGQEVAFERVIGCDGVQSRVRSAILQATSGHCADEPLEHSYKELSIPPGPNQSFRMEPNALHIWPRGEYMLIALPNLDGGFTATLFLPNEGEQGFSMLTTEAQVSAFFNEQFPDILALMPRIKEEFFRHPTGRLSTIRTTPWHFQDRALIVDDAAHAIVPFHGQGMNCEFEDCSAFHECLARAGEDWERAFTELEALRKPNADAIADLSLENYIESAVPCAT
jgi:hypothetical protein